MNHRNTNRNARNFRIMKRRIASLMIIVVVFLTGFFLAKTRMNAKADETVREIEGIIVQVENNDSSSVEVLTDDGELWAVTNYVAPLYTKCQVLFNTVGTEEINDDVIMSITTFTEFHNSEG